jgi:hypothetical protein
MSKNFKYEVYDIRLLTLSLFIITISIGTGCKDNSYGSDANAGNSLAIKVVNTGAKDLEVSTDGDASNAFCYSDSDCE